MKERYNIEGMTCSACSSHVDKAARSLSGVKNVNVNLLMNTMDIEYDEKQVTSKMICESIEKAGYKAILPNNTIEDKKEDDLKIRKHNLIASFIFLIPLFYISMGHMMSWPLPSILTTQENVMIFSLTLLILVLPIMYINRGYYIRGYQSLLHKSPNMDSLIAIGSSAAFIYSIYALYMMAYYLGRNNLEMTHHYMMLMYFESAGMILTLVSVGKYMEARSKKKTTDAISQLANLLPTTANILKDGKEIEVSVSTLQVGDLLVVRPGQTIATDGVIVKGNTSVNESMITGESMPVYKKENDQVIGATINQEGYIEVRVTSVTDTVLSNIIKLVEEASSSKAPIAKLADQISGIFVPSVMTISLITFIAWLIAGQSFHFALNCAISVLVISCPCALGLATPTAIMVSTGVGAKNGILIKSAEDLEMLEKTNAIVLDKTGTLTTGIPVVTEIIAEDEALLLKIAGSIESKSNHPLSVSIMNYIHDQNIEIEEVEDIELIPGGGIKGKYHNKQVLAGNKRLLESESIIIEDNKKLNTLALQGKTILYFTCDNKIIGEIAVADTLKDTSIKAVQDLKEMGYKVVMMTGDATLTASYIASLLDIEVISEVLPADKSKHIQHLQSQGYKVVMVGDGINDAPALTQADVGIAMGSGTDIAVSSSDITLMKNDLNDVVQAIKLSHSTIKNVKENLFWAFIYNIIGIPIAAGLFYPLFNITLDPMYGAAAMSFSSVFVVSNALRLRMFKGNKKVKVKKVKLENKQEGEKKMKVNIDGMMCKHCEAHVQKALDGIEGLKAQVVLEENCAYLEGDVNQEAVTNAIKDAGYDVVGFE